MRHNGDKLAQGAASSQAGDEGWEGDDMPAQRRYTFKQACWLLGIARSTLHMWLHARGLEQDKEYERQPYDRRYRGIKFSDLEALARQHTRPGGRDYAARLAERSALLEANPRLAEEVETPPGGRDRLALQIEALAEQLAAHDERVQRIEAAIVELRAFIRQPRHLRDLGINAPAETPRETRPEGQETADEGEGARRERYGRAAPATRPLPRYAGRYRPLPEGWITWSKWTARHRLDKRTAWHLAERGVIPAPTDDPVGYYSGAVVHLVYTAEQWAEADRAMGAGTGETGETGETNEDDEAAHQE